MPECMPSLPVRRTLVTGVRSFPFRDWRRTDGMPAVPGYNPVWDWQPVMTETMRASGVATSYITDNPMLEGPRFPDVRRPGGGPASSRASGIPGEIAALKRASAATARTFRAGINALGERPGSGRYFLAIDPFDPVDATEAPSIYVNPGEVEEEGIGRPQADFVRSVTGFAIGGVPPFGHGLPVVFDRALLDHERVWAAAGDPHSLFSVNPRELLDCTGAAVADVG